MLYASSREQEMALVPWSDEEKRQFLDDQFRLQTAHYDTHFADARFSIIEQDHQPIGRLYVHEAAGTVYVMDITLMPPHRNQGIGGALLRQVIEDAHTNRRRVTCHVEFNNPAQRLYSRLGFVRTGEHGVYFELELKPPQS